jgi:copper homeostasis protein
MKLRLEICADSVGSAVTASTSGADRIELCTSLPEGGTTPSLGMIVSAKRNLDIPVNVLIRPRSSDFIYDDDEFDIMRHDIELCGEAGADGVVIGVLLQNGEIDVERTLKLMSYAGPMSVTFHRAFDLTDDPFKALETLISAGVDRILTSGQKNTAYEGRILISELVKKAAGRVIIMPGSGITETNIEEIAVLTGAAEFHMSCRSIISSQMQFRREGIKLGSFSPEGEYFRKAADAQKIRRAKEILTGLEPKIF